jgi:hypothetical protein
MPPSDLRTECQTCGGWAGFTGRTHILEGRTYAVAHCPQCQADIPFWTPQIESRLAALERVRLLESIARSLCSVATGTEPEIRAALAAANFLPPPEAAACEISAGVLGLAHVRLRFAQPSLLRADLDRLFGQGHLLPRTGPFAPHKITYTVSLPGAPASVCLIASFRSAPHPECAPEEFVLRIGSPAAGQARARPRPVPL